MFMEKIEWCAFGHTFTVLSSDTNVHLKISDLTKFQVVSSEFQGIVLHVCMSKCIPLCAFDSLYPSHLLSQLVHCVSRCCRVLSGSDR